MPALRYGQIGDVVQMKIKKKVAILGSTGSVGTQTADVCERLGAEVVCITAGANVALLEEQIRKFKPKYAAVSDTEAAGRLKAAVSDLDTVIVSGYDDMCSLIRELDCDIVFNSISGYNGLLPTFAAVESGKVLALANKESMVCAGDLVNLAASKSGSAILPVDSEHCAIFQCLQNGKKTEVKRLLLTASGGPFFGYTKDMLKKVTVADTLKHPTWNMGRKITVDSASLANKGLEIIEASHLFGFTEDQVEVLIHRQSIIHSMVEYKDNAVIAQLSVPDMRHPAEYCLTYPDRVGGAIAPLDLAKVGTLTFHSPDTEAFPMLELARYSARCGGIMPCVYNAANEVAVDAFFKERISFTDIFEVTEATIAKTSNVSLPSLSDIVQADAEARSTATEVIRSIKFSGVV